MPSRIADIFRRNPYPFYATMRRLAPVAKVPGRKIWALFDYESVKTALQDPTHFSSRAAPPGGAPLDWLIFQDPPRHTQLRALINRTFTPRAVASLEPRVAELSQQLLDAVIDRGEMDLVGDFAARLPVLVICEMMGIPLEDAIRVTTWANGFWVWATRSSAVTARELRSRSTALRRTTCVRTWVHCFAPVAPNRATT